MAGIQNRLAELQSAREKMDGILAEIKKAGKKGMKELAAPLFKTYPDLIAFRWTQYTPYFCDGDPCEFSANTDYIDIKWKGSEGDGDGDDDDDEREEDEDSGELVSAGWFHDVSPDGRAKKSEDPHITAAREVIALLGAIGEDALKALFGDHVQITVARDGVDVEDYEHD